MLSSFRFLKVAVCFSALASLPLQAMDSDLEFESNTTSSLSHPSEAVITEAKDVAAAGPRIGGDAGNPEAEDASVGDAKAAGVGACVLSKALELYDTVSTSISGYFRNWLRESGDYIALSLGKNG